MLARARYTTREARHDTSVPTRSLQTAHKSCVIFLFFCNGGPEGRDFLYRYFPLSVVVGWKFVVLMTAVVALGQLEGWGETAVMVAINAVMFVRIGQHLRALASGE